MPMTHRAPINPDHKMDPNLIKINNKDGTKAQEESGEYCLVHLNMVRTQVWNILMRYGIYCNLELQQKEKDQIIFLDTGDSKWVEIIEFSGQSVITHPGKEFQNLWSRKAINTFPNKVTIHTTTATPPPRHKNNTSNHSSKKTIPTKLFKDAASVPPKPFGFSCFIWGTVSPCNVGWPPTR